MKMSIACISIVLICKWRRKEICNTFYLLKVDQRRLLVRERLSRMQVFLNNWPFSMWRIVSNEKDNLQNKHLLKHCYCLLRYLLNEDKVMIRIGTSKCCPNKSCHLNIGMSNNFKTRVCELFRCSSSVDTDIFHKVFNFSVTLLSCFVYTNDWFTKLEPVISRWTLFK